MAKMIAFDQEAREAIRRGVASWPGPSRSRSVPRAAT